MFVVVFRKKKSVSPRGPGPARRVAWVDADHGAQVMRVLCASTDNLFVIAREQRDRGDPVNYMCRIRDDTNTCDAMDPGLRRDDDIEKS